MDQLNHFSELYITAPSIFAGYTIISSWTTWVSKMTFISGGDRLLRSNNLYGYKAFMAEAEAESQIKQRQHNRRSGETNSQKAYKDC